MRTEWYGDKHKKRTHDWAVANLWTAAGWVNRDAKLLCPVKTGRLRSSIIPAVNEPQLRGQVSAGGEAMDGTIVKYARFVEQGTRFMEAQPYLIPALEKNRDPIRRLFGAK